MNFKQLRAFQEVMQTGSVSVAARNLHRTQPAVTSLLKGLEEDLQMKLFERKGGRLHPVPEAHYLFKQSGDILNRLHETRRAMQNVREQLRGTINIVSMPGPSVFILPELISNFVESRPDVDVTLVTRSSSQVQQLVSVQQYDMGLMDLGLQVESPMDEDLFQHQVFEHRCVCVMKQDDPLASAKVITPAMLDGKSMAMLYASHPTHVSTAAAFESAGAAFKVRFETQYFIPQFTFVERGLAYGIVDAMAIESYKLIKGGMGKLAFVPFEPVVNLRMSLLRPAHRGLSQVAEAFYTCVQNYLYQLSK